ncbi:hypothetical protein E2986_11224 [Frieseomelitta varia]|uniref:Uncharacterized protein n=1 Tax=Frieseomelitta varia TaxID=561572 RepID=A0A833S4N4_9HYME|nr:hypothetical protein E2986_11224 [Frieseomelitta varia]
MAGAWRLYQTQRKYLLLNDPVNEFSRSKITHRKSRIRRGTSESEGTHERKDARALNTISVLLYIIYVHKSKSTYILLYLINTNVEFKAGYTTEDLLCFCMQHATMSSTVSQIERVFTAASHKKVWDHFTKAQRKNIEMWKKQSSIGMLGS